MTKSPQPQFAIAMEYDGDRAPRVTARGFHETAEEILRKADQAGVPIHRDDALAAILTQLDLGERIPRELYHVIAEVLSFAFHVSGKHKPFMDSIATEKKDAITQDKN